MLEIDINLLFVKKLLNIKIKIKFYKIRYTFLKVDSETLINRI